MVMENENFMSCRYSKPGPVQPVVKSPYLIIIIIIILIIIIIIIFINVLSHQSDGQLQKQHNVETQVPKDNKQGTYETNRTNNRYLNH